MVEFFHEIFTYCFLAFVAYKIYQSIQRKKQLRQQAEKANGRYFKFSTSGMFNKIVTMDVNGWGLVTFTEIASLSPTTISLGNENYHITKDSVGDYGHTTCALGEVRAEYDRFNGYIESPSRKVVIKRNSFSSISLLGENEEQVGAIIFNSKLGRKGQGYVNSDITKEEFFLLMEASIWIISGIYRVLYEK